MAMPYLFAQNGLEYGASQSFAQTLRKLADKAAQWGPKYRVKPSVRDPWSRDLTRPEMMLKAASAMRRAAWGGLVKVEMGTERGVPAVFLVKKVMPPKPDPLRYYSGAIVDLSEFNDRVAKAAEYAKQKCPRVQCSGAVYTRPVAGTSIWSQHSKFPTGGNAVDLTIYNGDDPNKGSDMDATQDVCDVLVSAARGGHLALDQIIFRNQQYRHPGFAATDYAGIFHTHVHASGLPYQSGTPVDAS